MPDIVTSAISLDTFKLRPNTFLFYHSYPGLQPKYNVFTMTNFPISVVLAASIYTFGHSIKKTQ